MHQSGLTFPQHPLHCPGVTLAAMSKPPPQPLPHNPGKTFPQCSLTWHRHTQTPHWDNSEPPNWLIWVTEEREHQLPDTGHTRTRMNMRMHQYVKTYRYEHMFVPRYALTHEHITWAPCVRVCTYKHMCVQTHMSFSEPPGESPKSVTVNFTHSEATFTIFNHHSRVSNLRYTQPSQAMEESGPPSWTEQPIVDFRASWRLSWPYKWPQMREIKKHSRFQEVGECSGRAMGQSFLPTH